MTEYFKKKILKFLAHPDYTPVKLRSLARALQVPDEDYGEFKGSFEELRRAGRGVIGAKNLVGLPPLAGRVIGTFRANPKGFGFVRPLHGTSHGDLFVPPHATFDAMTGDTVMARVVKKGKQAGQMRYNGEILEVLERGQNKLVGTLLKQADGWIVRPDGTEFFEPVSVDDVTAKNAGENDKVVVEILAYPTDRYLARGVIIEVLGKAGQYKAEINAIIRQYQLPSEFDTECREQASKAAGRLDLAEHGRRDDITEQTIITIDPPDAKDFDDAISLSRDRDGNWVLGVHIADVSAFVPMDSPLDIEAKKRGNSVYLPGKVLPMLPEILSNGVCSLQPGQKRFAKSIYVTYDEQGNILDRNYANSIICSKARLTYQQADGVLKGKTKGFPGEVVVLLKDMEYLAKIIEKRRIKNGMIQLDLPETELIMDNKGRVVDAQPADDSYPHTIIEMFMVEANEAVAVLFDRFGIPLMRRIHPEPDSLSIRNVSRFIKICGIKLPRKLDRATIQDLLRSVKGRPEAFAINLAILRSLARAEYSPHHIGHFALASSNYCHFTSPIRRYADLMVHRLLDCYLEYRLNMIGLEEVLPEFELAEIGRHITFTEQRAEEAENELKTVLILQMLSNRIGEEMNSVVTGLTNFGVFVQCLRFGIEGLIQMEDLGVDEWRYDERSQRVVGRHSDKGISLGQPMKARIVSVNIPARQLNLAPAEPLVSSREQLKYDATRGGRRKRPVRKTKSATSWR
jgi:ribonuclease R